MPKEETRGSQHEPVEDVESEGDFAEIDERTQLAETVFSKEAKEEQDTSEVCQEIAWGEEMKVADSGAFLDLKEMLRCAKDDQANEEEKESNEWTELWGPAAKGKRKQGAGAEELKLNEAVDPDGGADGRSGAAEIGEGEVGDDEHRDGKEDGAGSVEILSSRGPEDVELLFDRDAPERGGDGVGEAMMRYIPVANDEEEGEQA